MTCPTCKNNLKTNIGKEEIKVIIKCKTCGILMGSFPKPIYNLLKFG